MLLNGKFIFRYASYKNLQVSVSTSHAALLHQRFGWNGKGRNGGGNGGGGWSSDPKMRKPRTADRRCYDGTSNLKLTLTRPITSNIITVRTPNPKSQIPTPKEFVTYLDRFVIGQEQAKKTLAVGVYQHYKRVENNIEVMESRMIHDALQASMGDNRRNITSGRDAYDRQQQLSVAERIHSSPKGMLIDKSNIVLLGPSGSGKTYMAQRLAYILDVPIAICDCTTLTQAGYVGDDVDSVIQKLVTVADGDFYKAERGIVFLDEFDKIYTSSDPLHTSGNRDVGGKGVQQALLRLVEGNVVRVKHPTQQNVKIEIDTTNILFIASGAFSNIERVIARRLHSKSLGFGSYGHEEEDLNERDELIVAHRKNRLLEECDQSDLIKFGMVPELVGRFPVLVPFHSLSHEQLIQVLNDSEESILRQTEQHFRMDGVEITFTRGALEEIASLAVKRNTGARALRSILEKILLEAKFEVPGSHITKVVITEETVRGQSKYRSNTPEDTRKDRAAQTGAETLNNADKQNI